MRNNISRPFDCQLREPISSHLGSIACGILDYELYGRLIQYFSNNGFTRQAKQLHARLVQYSVKPGNYLASKLICFYSTSKNLSFARHVFDQIPQKNTFSYNAMLIGYNSNEYHLDALRFFHSLAWSGLMDIKPDAYSVTCLLRSLSSLSFGGVKEVHGFVLRHRYDADIVVGNALVSYYSKCNDVISARKLFDRMRERDVVSWNSMISGYSHGGFFQECKRMFKKMVDCSGIKPDGVTLVSVLQACGQSSDLGFGIDVHRFLVDNQIEISVSVCTALVGLYAKCGSLDYARKLFEEMTEKDDATYGAMISGYMFHGFVDEAMVLFRETNSKRLITWNAVISGLVQNNRHEVVLDLVREMVTLGLRLDNVMISSILPTISHYSNLKCAKEMHALAIKNGYEKNIYVATSLIDAYSKSGYLQGAQRVFDQSKGMSLIIWTAIISAYASHGDADTSLNLFDEMLNNGIQPDSVAFIAVLTACAHSGMVNKAWEIFDSMFMKYGLQPSDEHYACVVGVLSRAGKLPEAKEFVSKMPIKPSAKVWGALLNGASVFGDVELGKFVCDHLFEIEPENTGNYIIMANLYSQAGRWKEADIVREKLTKIGIKKTRGGSWVETSMGS